MMSSLIGFIKAFAEHLDAAASLHSSKADLLKVGSEMAISHRMSSIIITEIQIALLAACKKTLLA